MLTLSYHSLITSLFISNSQRHQNQLSGIGPLVLMKLQKEHGFMPLVRNGTIWDGMGYNEITFTPLCLKPATENHCSAGEHF